MKTGFIAYNQGSLYYEVSGRGMPVVFVHGFSLSHKMWMPQVTYFSNTHQVITYDMRGFGESSIPKAPYTHHDDLHALLQHLKLGRIHLVGLSLGGEVAINFTLAYPQYVQSLTLVDSAIGGYKSTVNWNVYAKEHGISIAKTNWLNHEVFSATRENEYAFAICKDIITNYSGWHWLHADPGIRNPNALENLETITVPVLIMVGEKDLEYFRAMANLLQAKIKNAHKEILPNTGHMPNLENSELFNSMLANFLTNNS